MDIMTLAKSYVKIQVETRRKNLVSMPWRCITIKAQKQSCRDPKSLFGSGLRPVRVVSYSTGMVCSFNGWLVSADIDIVGFHVCS
jgi:hypothetical protein